MVWSGLSEVIGSWKMIEISLPRISRTSFSDDVSRSRPRKRMLPEGCEALGYGSSFRIDSALTDFPEPDSPTSATHSPRLMENEIRSTASVLPNATERSRTSSKGWLMASMRGPLPERLARIEGVARGFADEDQQRQHDRDREESREAEPRRLHVGFRLRQQFAERRRAGRQAKAEEIQRRQRHHRGRHDERQERHGRHHRIRQQMAEHDGGVGDAERARRLDIFEVSAAQEFGAYQPHQRYPGEQQQDAEQDEEARWQHRRYDQQQIERGNRVPDFDEALETEIDPAAEIALHPAGGDADDRRNNSQCQAEQNRDAETVDQARHHVAALVVGAEPVIFEVAAAGEMLLLHHFAALLLGQHPGRLRRRRRRQIEIVGVVGIADQRPKDAAALVGDLLLQIGIAVIGRGLEVAAEGSLGIADKGRPVEMAVILDEEATSVGDQLGEQVNKEQDQENPERPVTALV